jgi:SsrA-binding protein
MDKLILRDKKVLHNYSFEEIFEAGISLQGCEVKSIREGRLSLKDSFVQIKDGEAFIYNLYIAPYSHTTRFQPEPTRPRKLLLTKRELKKLFGKLSQKGLVLVPFEIFFRRGWAKIKLGLGRRKKLVDKRRELKEKALRRELRREKL